MVGEIPVAVLGAGKMGLIHCEAIAATRGLTLVAASSRSRERLAAVKDKFDVTTYQSHDELLKDPRIQWVVIATTTDEHKKWAIRALRSEKRLIIEKPIALSHEEATAIFEEAGKRKLAVTVHLNRRWDRDFQLVQAVLRDSLLGDVYRIESRYTSFSSGWAGWGAQGMANPWRLKRSYGGGLLSDWGPHLLDQALLLVNSEVRSLYAGMFGKIWTTEVDDHFWAELTFTDGRSLRVEASNNSRIPLPRWYIIGTEGTLMVRGGALTDWDTAVIRKEFDEFPQEVRIDIDQRELSTGFYQEFVKAVTSGGSLPVAVGDVLKVSRLMDAVRQSASSGRSVTID